MVDFIVTGNERTDQAGGGLGWLSFQFQLGAQVTNVSDSGFTLERDVLAGIPNTPTIPDPAPDVYEGTNLQFTDVTHFGTTLATPSSGLITNVRETGSNFTSTATGLNIDAADFYRVTATRSNHDNVQLLKDVFSGSDLFKGGSARDKFNGFNGSDNIQGRGGHDKLWGGGGRDSMDGGKGNDILIGGAGKDSLAGGKGNDTLRGSAGDDSIIGGAGNDTLEGGKGGDVLRGQAGRDVFLFKGNNLGEDTIENWTDGQDRIEIDLAGITQFSDLSLSRVGDDLEISYANNTIVVQGAGTTAFDASDFIF